MRRTSLLSAVAAVLASALALTASPTLAQNGASGKRLSGMSASAPSSRTSSTGPYVWKDPGDVSSLDFVNGPGGAKNAPKPPFTFVEEDMGGSNPKIKITDANGTKWGVKWGSEVNAEVFASRIAWAAGYFVEPTYFVKSGRIEGVTGLTRAKKHVSSDGSFVDARFELKEKGITKAKDDQSWRWDQNPFVGTRELNGLKIVMMLTSNWDSKDQRDAGRGSNTAVFSLDKTGEQRYVFTDWGGSMGKWGGVLGREKWDCKGYASQTKSFVKGVKGGTVEFGYSGQRTSDIREGITVDHVRWIVGYLDQISDAQLRAGLDAAGATPDEVDCFTTAIRERINQLKRASSGGM